MVELEGTRVLLKAQTSINRTKGLLIFWGNEETLDRNLQIQSSCLLHCLADTMKCGRLENECYSCYGWNRSSLSLSPSTVINYNQEQVTVRHRDTEGTRKTIKPELRPILKNRWDNISFKNPIPIWNGFFTCFYSPIDIYGVFFIRVYFITWVYPLFLFLWLKYVKCRFL